MKRLLQYTSQKITTHPQRSLMRFFSSHFMQNDNFSIVNQKNKTTTSHFAHSLLALALTSYLLLLPLISLPHGPTASTMHQATLARISSLLLLLVSSTLLLTCSVSLACMYTLHACSASRIYYVHASLLYLYTSHLVLRVTMHLLHTIHYTTALYLYSVLLGRAGSAVVLQRLLNIRCLLFCSAQCSTSSRTSIRE